MKVKINKKEFYNSTFQFKDGTEIPVLFVFFEFIFIGFMLSLCFFI